MQEIPLWLREMEAWANIFQAVATPVLIAIGGVFAWYKFFRQGEHDPRLQLTVTGEVTVRGGTIYIVGKVSVQNTGQVNVALDLEPSGFLVLSRRAGMGWRNHNIVYGVFPGQEKAQPNETLEDQIWIELEQEDAVAVCLELVIAETSGLTWRTQNIVSLLDAGHSSSDRRNY